METNQNHSIQKTQQTGLATMPAESLIKLVYQFNQLRSFSLTAIEIVEWAASIQRLLPDWDYGALSFAIEKMKIGEIPYDRNIGIQNIFNAYKQVIFENGEYRILKLVW